jgi:hypothetical protein
MRLSSTRIWSNEGLQDWVSTRASRRIVSTRVTQDYQHRACGIRVLLALLGRCARLAGLPATVNRCLPDRGVGLPAAAGQELPLEGSGRREHRPHTLGDVVAQQRARHALRLTAAAAARCVG